MKFEVNDRLVTGLKVAYVVLMFAVGFAAGWRLAAPRTPAPKPDVTPAPAPAPKPAPEPDAKPEWFGLRYGPNHKALAASMPRLSQAAPGLMRARSEADGRPILLYKAWTDVFRSYPPYEAQQIGDCVSFAHAHALDLLQTIEWCLKHPGRAPIATDIQETHTEFIYATSREVGGLLRSDDGSYGAAACKAMAEIGTISRRMLGDQGAYSGARARRWGRTGAPASVKAMAGKFKLGAAAQVSTYEELVAALAAGHPVTICTQHGFNLKRDSQGFCRQLKCWPMADGCGGHCMFIAGCRFDRPGALIVQSWGPDTPSGPTSLGQPSFSFWADRAAIESILAEGDSWALSAAPHFGAAAAKGKRKLPDAWRRAA